MASFVETKKILIVVDVQNCFLDNILNITNANLNSKNKDASITIIKEIETLYNENDHVIFTRDAHPLGHKSFTINDEKSIWPEHCRMNYQCGTENFPDTRRPRSSASLSDVIDENDKQIIINKFNKNKNTLENILKENASYQIIGNQLSYYYLFTSLKEVLIDLNNSNKNNTITIGDLYLNERNQKVLETEYNNINYPNTDKKYIQLLKGQRCEEDANSAFNYHLGYGSKTGFYDELSNRYNATNSTGLWEYLLQKFPNENLEITICGMVGNVCVIFTVTEGLILWNKIYKESELNKNKNRNVVFNFSFCGTAFLPGMLPSSMVVRPEIDIFKGEFATERITSGDGYRILPSGYTFVADELSTIGTITTPNKENYTFKILPYKTAQQMGGKKYKKCPKCKKNHYHGGKCFICGFIPFLGKTKTQKRKGKRTRKNKRRITRKTHRSF